MDQQKQMFKQMLEFNQTTFTNTFNAAALLQDQLERVAKTGLDQATWLPAEGRKVIENWVDAYKTGRENFKNYMDDSYKKVEEFFAK